MALLLGFEQLLLNGDRQAGDLPNRFSIHDSQCMLMYLQFLSPFSG